MGWPIALADDYRFKQMTDALIEMYRVSRPRGCGYADYEIQAISGEGYDYMDDAAHALGFRHEHFDSRNLQALSCDICGGLFIASLDVMRRHRYKCGWDK